MPSSVQAEWVRRPALGGRQPEDLTTARVSSCTTFGQAARRPGPAISRNQAPEQGRAPITDHVLHKPCSVRWGGGRLGGEACGVTCEDRTDRCAKREPPSDPAVAVVSAVLTGIARRHNLRRRLGPDAVFGRNGPQRLPPKPALRSSRTRTPPMPSWDGPKIAPVTMPASPPVWTNVLPRTAIR